MDFVVFECRNTFELGKESSEAGFEVWLPTYFDWKKDSQGNRCWKEILAISGYIYVPADEMNSFRRWESNRYGCRVMMEYFGPGDLPGPKREVFMRPYIVGIRELQILDNVLKTLTESNKSRYMTAPDKELRDVFCKGDSVKIKFGPFANMVGTVEKIKRDGDVRVKLNSKNPFYVNINPKLIDKTVDV